MTYDVQFLNDYLEWSNGVESLGVDASPEAYIAYRSQLDLEQRAEAAASYLVEMIWAEQEPTRSRAKKVWEILTGLSYTDPVQPSIPDQLAIKRAAKAEPTHDPNDAA